MSSQQRVNETLKRILFEFPNTIELIQKENVEHQVRASVALIIRLVCDEKQQIDFRHNCICNTTNIQHSIDCLRSFATSSFSRKANDIQLLYIKRSERKDDKFSGHVAFPGGHREKSETDLDAALRETREEVGLDMKHGNSENNLFHCCGRMTETQPFRQSKVVVSPFVFIQLQSKTPKLKLDSQEVASIRWTSLFHFEELENVLSHHQMALPAFLPAIIQETILGLGHVIVPSSDLPDHGNDEDRNFVRTLDSQEHKLEEKEKLSLVNEKKLEHELEHHEKPNKFQNNNSETLHKVAERKLQFILWGMTLGVTIDFLNLISEKEKKKLILPEPHVNNKIVNFIFFIVVSLFGLKGGHAMHGIKISVSIFISILIVFTFLFLINMYSKQK